MKYAFWPGCVSRGATPELYTATRAVARTWGSSWWNWRPAACTGAGIISDSDPYLQDVLNARTMAMAEQMGLPLLDICSTCVGVHSLTAEKLQDVEFRARVNERLAPEGLEYTGAVEPRHLVWVLLEDLAEGEFARYIKKPLSELSLGPFYGCYILRPERVLGFEAHPERRTSLEKVIELVGATVVDYEGKTKCCGFPLLTTNKRNSLSMAGGHVGEAKDKGADALVTPCPLCHLNLDAQQPDAAKVVGRKLDLPILHLPQMLGLAMGIAPKDLGLDGHVVSTKRVLQKIGVR